MKRLYIDTHLTIMLYHHCIRHITYHHLYNQFISQIYGVY
nr:MAG TPA: hypothetical protein [Caudoviricetes sp.]